MEGDPVYDAAKAAIEKVFSNPAYTRREAVDALENLQGEIGSLVAALEADERREARQQQEAAGYDEEE